MKKGKYTNIHDKNDEYFGNYQIIKIGKSNQLYFIKTINL